MIRVCSPENHTELPTSDGASVCSAHHTAYFCAHRHSPVLFGASPGDYVANFKCLGGIFNCRFPVPACPVPADQTSRN